MIATINLGEILWSLLVIYVMVMYLILVFTVVADIFRSDDLSGVSKALWALALLVLPFFTLLAYLIIRGGEMNKRHAARFEAAKADSDAYIRSVAGAGGPASELEKAKGLLDAGGISQDEYAQLKLKILA